jgi:hypothetical protein
MRRIFLDTNIYIIGQLKPLSPAEQLLKWVGYYTTNNQSQIKVIISQELINQILRVGKRLKDKDWAAKTVAQIWQNLNCLFIPETDEMKTEASKMIAEKLVPLKNPRHYHYELHPLQLNQIKTKILPPVFVTVFGVPLELPVPHLVSSGVSLNLLSIL